MAGDMSLSGFFRLPRELRDEIYQYILAYTSAAPPDPSFVGPRFRIRDILYPQFLEVYPSVISLSLTNRQLYDELRQAMQASSMTIPERGIPPPSADLDVMVKGFMYYPTWTYLPPTADLTRGKPYDLNVNLRIFSTESFQSNDGWPRQPGAGFRSLMHLLGQLVQNGPALFYTPSIHRANAHRAFLINRMTVNVLFQGNDSASSATRTETARNVFRMLKVLARDGIAGGAIETIAAKTQYEKENGVPYVFEREWKVTDQLNSAKARDWGAAGFFFAALVA